MSAHRDWRLLVADIIEYSSDIAEITAGMDFDAFATNRVAQLAVCRCLEIMGEAAHHVPPEVQTRCPEVAWRLMNDMRNVLIHAYATINLRIVWNAAVIDVPPTRERLAQLLAEEGATDS